MRRAIVASILALCPQWAPWCTTWPMVNNCRERTSWARGETLLAPPLRLECICPLLDMNMAYADAVLYVTVTGYPAELVAFDTEAEEELWRFPIPKTVADPGFVPAVAESLVLAGGQQGLGLHAVDRSCGRERWFKPIAANLYCCSPVIDGDRVYLVADSTYCIDLATGATRWTYPYASQGSPAVDDSSVYVPWEGGVMALDKITGRVKWTSTGRSERIKGLLVRAPHVYVAVPAGLKAILTANGQVDWEIPLEGEWPWLGTNAMAAGDDALFSVMREPSSQTSRLLCHERSTGQLRWVREFSARYAYTPTVANGIVYLTTQVPGHALWGLDVVTGEPVWHDESQWFMGQPIVGDHRLFVNVDFGVAVFASPGSAPPRPWHVRVLPAYPNPCRDAVWIPIVLAQPSWVSARLVGADGRVRATLPPRWVTAGLHTVRWAVEGFPPGLYLCGVQTRAGTEWSRVSVLR